MVTKSMKPKIAASKPMRTPAPTSQIEARAQKGSAVPQNTRSVASTPTRNAIGNGTSIGWIGCPKSDAVLRTPLLISSAMTHLHLEDERSSLIDGGGPPL